MTANYNCPNLHTSHTLNFHLSYLANFKSKIYLTLYGGFPQPSANVSLLATPLQQKSPSRLSTSYLLAIHGQFQAASLLSRVGRVGGWVWQLSNLTLILVQLALHRTGTEFGNSENSCPLLSCQSTAWTTTNWNADPSCQFYTFDPHEGCCWMLHLEDNHSSRGNSLISYF